MLGSAKRPSGNSSPGAADLAVAKRRLNVLVDTLNQTYGSSMVVPTFHTLKELKTFCVSLSEKSPPPGYSRSELGLRKRAYLSISHSLFLFRKTLPSPDPDLAAYRASLSSLSKGDETFMNFCSAEIPEMFKSGWDRSYEGRVSHVVVSTKSCQESTPKKRVTSRAYVTQRYTREQFIALVQEGTEIPNIRRVSVVRENGKSRIVTIASALMSILGPLSDMIYSHISRKNWLLRGDAKPTSFKGFLKTDGEVFVSGDYESATDNLNTVHQRHILDQILKTAPSLSDGLKKSALSTFDATLQGKGVKSFKLGRGQLMGDRLSFPLLCIVNYLAFKYVMRQFGQLPPVKINGDDIVFRATPHMAEAWFEGVKKSGLVVSKGKTMIDSEFFSLNSNVFQGGRTKVLQVSFVRSKPIFLPGRSLSLRERYYASTVGLKGAKALPARRTFLLENSSHLAKSQVSLLRGHQIVYPPALLRHIGLSSREFTYLSLHPKLDRLPAVNLNGLPENVKVVVPQSAALKKAAVRSADKVAEACVRDAWNAEKWAVREEPMAIKGGPVRCPASKSMTKTVVNINPAKTGLFAAFGLTKTSVGSLTPLVSSSKLTGYYERAGVGGKEKMNIEEGDYQEFFSKPFFVAASKVMT